MGGAAKKDTYCDEAAHEQEVEGGDEDEEFFVTEAGGEECEEGEEGANAGLCLLVSFFLVISLFILGEMGYFFDRRRRGMETSDVQ